MINKRKGALLLQTLVLSVIMAMIGIMILKWVLARYILASRFYRSTVSRARVEGCLFKKVSDWGGANPAPLDAPTEDDCKFELTNTQESPDKEVKIECNVPVIGGTAIEIVLPEQETYY